MSSGFSQPMVSIALCTYNGERFLQQQLDSLADQDYENVEIIIVDDCSTDRTYELLQGFESSLAHVKLWRNPSNLGFVANFEKAISLCSGDYIALCDQDDIWLPEKISALVSEIGDAGLIYSSVQLMDQQGSLLADIFPRRNKLSGRCYMEMLFSNHVTGHACLINRPVLKRALPFPKAVKVHDHWLAVVAAAKEGISFHDGVLSYYRKHDDNALLSNKRRRKGRWAKALSKVQSRKEFLTAVMQVEGISSDDRALIQQIIEVLTPSLFLTNKKLERILLQSGDRLLAAFPDRDKAIRKLTRPLYRALL